MIEHKYFDLLKEFNTDKNPHTNRTLSNHLIRTSQRGIKRNVDC